MEPDEKTLRAAFPFADVPAGHPLRALWSEPTERARDALHHLADDVRMVENVPGAKSLFKSMRTDPEGFDDFRYELRVGAAIARSAGQKLLRMGGPSSGPDIEFEALSGHTCGVACYRARSRTRAVEELHSHLGSIARSFFRRFVFYDVPENLLLEMIFPRATLTKREAADAFNVLYDFWLRWDVAQVEQNGIKVTRQMLPHLPPVAGQRRRARLRLIVPLRKAERERVLRQLDQKIAKEIRSWASGYKGVPLFAVEESDAIHNGCLREDLDAIMADANQTFAGFLLTYYPSRGIESGDWVPRRSSSLGLHIGIETFGPNLSSWSEGHTLMSVTPDHAKEEWEFVRTGTGSYSILVHSLSLGSHYARLPLPCDLTLPPTADPKFQEHFKAAMESIQREQQRVLPSPDFIGSLSDEADI
ncbi:MAG: hypothetical protein IPK71_05775 [Myxococcales bacterium]|nr:hypothetical protein [Myxococcales bacterium]